MTGRPRTCECNECPKCKHREYMRGWYQRKTMDERREWIGKRDIEKVRASDAARYYRDPDKRRAAQKQYQQTETGKKKMEEARSRWVEKNPHKRKAHHAVASAVKIGELKKGVCAVGVDCNGRIEAHHDDYSKPLDVRWLCKRHHAHTWRTRTIST